MSERVQYRIDACLGKGGFGEVYRATGPEGLVALKVLRKDLDPSSQAIARLRDEARWLSLLHHPCVPRVDALGSAHGRLCLVVEYIDGEDLSKALRSDDPPPIAAMVEIVAEVADALDAAWNKPVKGHDGPLRLVHRDIKPSNLRLRREGGVVLLDLGIARTDELSRDAQTQTSGFVGSPGYLAPERFSVASPHSADDVFGLGCVLYEGLMRRRLLADLSMPAYAGLSSTPHRLDDVIADRLEQLPRDLPDLLHDLLASMVRADPDERPSMAGVRDACRVLAPLLPGSDLATWSATHPWPEQPTARGPWVGRTIEVKVLDRSAEAAARIASGPTPMQMGMLFVASAAIGAAVVLTALPTRSTTAPSQPLPEPASAAVDVPAATLDLGDLDVEDDPKPPSRASTLAAGLPSRPVESARAPRPEGSVEVAVDPRGSAEQVVLVRGDVRTPLPGRLPPGRYTVLARFDGMERVAGEIDLVAGEDCALRCAHGLCKQVGAAP